MYPESRENSINKKNNHIKHLCACVCCGCEICILYGMAIIFVLMLHTNSLSNFLERLATQTFLQRVQAIPHPQGVSCHLTALDSACDLYPTQNFS